MEQTDLRELAEHVRRACVEAAQAGYEQAAVAGLCHDGAVTASVDAIRMLDLETLVCGWQGRAHP